MRAPPEQNANNTLKSRSIAFACAIVFIDMMGLGLVAPVMPELIIELSDFTLAKAATISGYLLFLYALMMFLAAPLVGALSDQFGRRPVALFAMAGLTLDYLVMAYTQTLALLFVGRALAGLLGATYPVANAVVADVENLDKRAKSFGLIAAAGGLGFICGPAVGGLLASFGLRTPFLLAAALCGLIVILAYFLFPETREKGSRRKIRLRNVNPIGSFLNLGHRNQVWRLLLALFFFQLAFQTIATLWAFFGAAQFEWGPNSIGLSIAFYGLLVAFVQGALVSPAIKYLGESRTGLLGVSMAFLGYIGLSVVDSEPFLYTLIVLTAMAGLGFPAMQSMMSRQISEDQQGELQGAIASVVSLSSIVGPIVTSQIFFLATERENAWPGAPFLISALCCAISLALLFNLSQRAPIKSVNRP